MNHFYFSKIQPQVFDYTNRLVKFAVAANSKISLIEKHLTSYLDTKYFCEWMIERLTLSADLRKKISNKFKSLREPTTQPRL